jgi:hypothetical protein
LAEEKFDASQRQEVVLEVFPLFREEARGVVQQRDHQDHDAGVRPPQVSQVGREVLVRRALEERSEVAHDGCVERAKGERRGEAIEARKR